MNSVDNGLDTASIARTFVEARRAGRGLAHYPGDLPHALAEGYAIQDAALALVDDRIVGWKVGRVNPPMNGVDRLAGPILSRSVVHSQNGVVSMSVFRDGFAAAEAEFILRVGPSFDADRTSFSLEDTIAAIDAVHVGIEVASSPFPGINDHGAAVTISDFGNNNGLVIGANVGGPAMDFDSWQVELLIDSVRAGQATTATMLDGPIGAARFLFEALAARGIALRPGDWISSGAVTGVHPVEIGNLVEARFANSQSVTCAIISA